MSTIWIFRALSQDSFRLFGNSTEEQREEFIQQFKDTDASGIEEGEADLDRTFEILQECLESGIDYTRYESDNDKSLLDNIIYSLNDDMEILEIEDLMDDPDESLDPVAFGVMLIPQIELPDGSKTIDDFWEIARRFRYPLGDERRNYQLACMIEAEKRGLKLFQWLVVHGTRFGQNHPFSEYLLMSPSEIKELISEINTVIGQAETNGQKSLAQYIQSNIIPVLNHCIEKDKYLCANAG